MLGRERFLSIESPNVIDPGDDAPIQPNRRQAPQQPSGESSAAPVRSSRAPIMGRTQKIDLGDYQSARQSRLINSVDDLDLEQPADDDGYDDVDMQPSIDEARNYANTLLKDYDKRTSLSRDVMMGTEEPTNQPAGLMLASSYVTNTELDGSSSKHLVRNRVLPVMAKVTGGVTAFVVLIIILAKLIAA